MSRSSAPFSPVQSRRRAEWYAQRGRTGAAVQATQAQQTHLQQMQEIGAASSRPVSLGVCVVSNLHPADSNAAAAGAAAGATGADTASLPLVDRGAARSVLQPAVAVVAGTAEASASLATCTPTRHAAGSSASAAETTAPTDGSSVSGNVFSAEHGPSGQQQVHLTKKIGLKGGFGIGKKRSKRKGGNVFGAAAAEVRVWSPTRFLARDLGEHDCLMPTVVRRKKRSKRCPQRFVKQQLGQLHVVSPRSFFALG